MATKLSEVDWARTGKWVWGVALTGVVAAIFFGARGCDPGPGPDPTPPPAAGIEIVGEDTVEPCCPLDLTVNTKGATVEWIEPDTTNCWLRTRSADGKVAVFAVKSGAKAGDRFRLVAHTSVKGKSHAATKWITVAGTPTPPGPQPVPPQPVPPAPVPVPGGFRAVIVYESAEKMTKEATAAVYSPKVATYLDAKCADGRKDRKSTV